MNSVYKNKREKMLWDAIATVVIVVTVVGGMLAVLLVARALGLEGVI